MNIKRLYIKDGPRLELCWEDEYGNWYIGDTNSPNAFAQGMLPSPSPADRHTEGPHPEVKPRTIFSDFVLHGESGDSWEVECIVEPVIIEAYRRWNAGWYDDQPAGTNLELPKPGKWTIEPNGDNPTRISDV